MDVGGVAEGVGDGDAIGGSGGGTPVFLFCRWIVGVGTIG